MFSFLLIEEKQRLISKGPGIPIRIIGVRANGYLLFTELGQTDVFTEAIAKICGVNHSYLLETIDEGSRSSTEEILSNI